MYPTFTIFFQVLILLNFDSNLLQESSDQQSELARDTYPKEVREPGAQLPGIICFVVLVLGLFSAPRTWQHRCIFGTHTSMHAGLREPAVESS